MSFIIKRYRPIRFRRASGKITHGIITAVNADGTVNIRSGSGNNILSVPILTNAATGRKFAGVSTPAAPTALVGTAGDTTASIAFTAASSGGSAITNYEYSTDNGSTFTARSPVSTASPLAISGLTNSTTYQIKLRAVNLLGAGASSSAVSVTPVGASAPAFRSASTITTQNETMVCPMPAGVTAGDILIAHAMITFDPKSGTWGDQTYAGWTRRGYAGESSGTGFWYALYTKTAGASESSFTWTGGANWWGAQMSIVAVSGATAVDAPGDMYSGLTGLSLNATTTNGLLLGFWNGDSSGTGVITPPGTMTQRVNSQFRSTSTVRYLNTMVATQTLTASGATGNRTATVSAGTLYGYSHLIVVK
jgi:hypothetical protein